MAGENESPVIVILTRRYVDEDKLQTVLKGLFREGEFKVEVRISSYSTINAWRHTPAHLTLLLLG